MRGVFFDQRVASVARSSYRADVALFVGFVEQRRDAVVFPALQRWLVREGWARGGVATLRNIPVPIDSFETFDRLFAWDERPWGTETCDTYLGCAVRSFFAQGGRLCYVVSVGAPWSVPLTHAEADAAVGARDQRIDLLIPRDHNDPADERTHWHGVWLMHGLPDVSFVALPDLPDIVRAPIAADRALPPPPPLDVGFVECSEPPGRPVEDLRIRELRAPAADDDGFAAWAKALFRLVREIERPRAGSSLREVQVIAAVPRPVDDHVGADLLRYLTKDLPGGIGAALVANGIATAFLQLVYPWLSTMTSQRLPGGIEPPDGALVGALAGNALERGTYRSAGGRRLFDVFDALPVLSLRDVRDPSSTDTLSGRVTLVGRVPGGIEILSDVTTSSDPTFRLAHANRLMSALVRALRTIGEAHAFEPNSELVWSLLRGRAIDVLRQFWRAGALRGSDEADAFSVRCDRSTTTQDDLDNGRVIVEVTVSLSVSIQRINVTVTRNGGFATLEDAA